ncbi:MAG: hypothetical protein ACKVWR_13820 [Acidimicrobiales bacterium]
MALLRRALLSLGVAAAMAAALRLKGADTAAPKPGGWRPLAGPDLR